MDRAFWLEAWITGKTRFHKEDTNKVLLDYGSILMDSETIFVPLCGKTLDMVYLLSKGKKVIGVELSALAVDSFFKENNLSPEITNYKSFIRYQIRDLTIYCGDLFDLTQYELGNVDAVYDRASMVALPKNMREKYVKTINDSCPRLQTILLSSFEYDQSKTEGPPFSVLEEEIREFYKNRFQIEKVNREIVEDKNPRFENSGISEFAQTVYQLTAFK